MYILKSTQKYKIDATFNINTQILKTWPDEAANTVTSGEQDITQSMYRVKIQSWFMEGNMTKTVVTLVHLPFKLSKTSRYCRTPFFFRGSFFSRFCQNQYSCNSNFHLLHRILRIIYSKQYVSIYCFGPAIPYWNDEVRSTTCTHIQTHIAA